MPFNLNGIRVVVVEDHGDSPGDLKEMLRVYGAVVTTYRLQPMLLPSRRMRTSSSPTSRCHLVKMACGSWSK
jgi:hypothetical protein